MLKAWSVEAEEISSFGDGTSAVDGKKELDIEWEVDGSKIEVLLG